jgi:hypothetical protein
LLRLTVSSQAIRLSGNTFLDLHFLLPAHCQFRFYHKIMADRKTSTVSVNDRRRSVAEEPVTSVLKGGDVPMNKSGKEWNADEEVLAALGYKPEFKREFTRKS